MVQVRKQKYGRMFLNFNFHIWLNLPKDHRHFGYITKLTKNTPSQNSQEQDKTATKTTKSGRFVFCDLTDKIGKTQCMASISPVMYPQGEAGTKVKAKTRSLGSTQLAIRIIHNTHVGRVRRVHVRSETVHRSA
jgi:hypothetical protein